MGEISILLPLGVAVASFVVVPFLGWGITDPGAQWQQVRSWTGDADAEFGAGQEMWHRLANVLALALWLALLVWLFASAG